MSRRALLFANLRSGRAKAFIEAVQALRDAGIEVEVRFDLSKDAVGRAVEETGVDLVIAFGGDGTIGSVVDGLAGQEVVLGIIAGGTSNNFARSMGIRPNIKDSVAIIAAGRVTEIDVGEVNGHRFAHAAIMGLNVAFAHRVQRYRAFLGRFSYPLASLLVYRSRRPMSLTVTENGAVRETRTYQLAILNSSVFGGPLELKADQAHARNGKLSVQTVDDLRLRTVVKGLPRIFFERHLGLPGGSRFDMIEGQISSPEPLDITLDGEIKTQTPATVRILPCALRVLARAKDMPG